MGCGASSTLRVAHLKIVFLSPANEEYLVGPGQRNPLGSRGGYLKLRGPKGRPGTLRFWGLMVN